MGITPRIRGPKIRALAIAGPLVFAVVAAAPSSTEPSSATTTTPPTPSTVGATTTSAPVPTGSSPVMDDIEVVRSTADLDEPICPPSEPPGPDAGASEDPVSMAGMSAANTYGVPLGQEFRGSGLWWVDGQEVVIASFVANVGEHRRQLEALVDEPERLLVCRARLTAAESNELVAELEPELDGIGVANAGGVIGRVTVDLHGGPQDVPEAIWQRYGDRVAITYGRFPYPMPDPLPDAVCPTLPPNNDDFAPAAAGTQAFEGSSRDPGNLDVSFVNRSDHRTDFMTGHPDVYLAEPGTRSVVSTRGVSVGVTALGLAVRLAPGEVFESSSMLPVAACDPALGHLVPPGRYEAYAVYSVVQAEAGIEPGDFTVGPIPVEIT